MPQVALLHTGVGEDQCRVNAIQSATSPIPVELLLLLLLLFFFFFLLLLLYLKRVNYIAGCSGLLCVSM
jgi:hypothetical protein